MTTQACGGAAAREAGGAGEPMTSQAEQVQVMQGEWPPCGCLPDMHPGETHAEHTDSLVRRMNEQAIGRILANPGSWPLWRFALNAMIDDELRRLQEKRRRMEVG